MTQLTGVPYYKQDTEITCGPAALQMILGYFGEQVSEEHLAHEAHTGHDYGTHHKWLIEVARAHGLHAYLNNGSSLREAEEYLEQNIPVLVHYLEPEANEGHYAVVVGIDSQTIVLNDPWLGEGFSLSRAEFETRWHDERNQFRSWLMAFSREPFSTGVQYHPTHDSHNK